jgi:hypothetical protein
LNSISLGWEPALIAASLLGWLLAALFAAILAWTLWKYNSSSLTFAQAWKQYAEQAADMSARHAKIIPPFKPSKLSEPLIELGQAVMQYDGADVEAMEQPEQPIIRQTAVVDELHEIERELNRFRNDDIDWEKRENFEPV